MNLATQAAQAHRAGRLAEAARHYHDMLQAQPDDFDALHMLGVLLSQQGQQAAALPLFERAVSLRPNVAAAWVNRGLALASQDRHHDAADSFDKALAISPDYPEAHFNRANTFVALTRFKEADADFARAVALRPDYVDAHYNRGLVLAKMNHHPQALRCFDVAIALHPSHVGAHVGRGHALGKLRRQAERLCSHEQALILDPNNVPAWLGKGSALQQLDRYDEALAAYDRAIELAPKDPTAVGDRGNALQRLHRHDDAVASYDRALALEPGVIAAQMNRGICLLLMGRYEQGWRDYHTRWAVPEFADANRQIAGPVWIGDQPIAGKRILLQSEQGLGDTIQFCRYAKRVADQGAEVLLSVQRELQPLLANVDGASAVFARSDPLPPFDLQCPLLSLPLACGTTVDSVPYDMPYLVAPQDRIETWRARLGPRNRLRVGLAWSGQQRHINDRNRSMLLAQLAPLDRFGVALFGLQKDVRGVDRAMSTTFRNLQLLGDEITDFRDTAALLTLMDVVVTVDTSIAHLAGALARPLLLMLPNVCDWRWMLNRDDSPWYPTAHLFRQTRPGHWSDVIQRVCAHVATLCDRFPTANA
jgi:tetratricopeptide (TPR) repeat protein